MINLKFIEDRLISTNLDPHVLQGIVQLFQIEISSRRKLSSIHSLSDLFEVLHSLDICNEYETTAYKDISLKLGDEALYNFLRNMTTTRSMPGVNLYALQRISEEEQEQVTLMEQLSIEKNKDLDDYNGHREQVRNNSLQQTSNSPNFTADSLGPTKKIIYKLINDKIGRKWRDFGRELNIPEGDMDIFLEKPDTRVFKILDTFESDPRRQKTMFISDLTEALTKSRRKDIAKDIMRILANN